jgi:hypothetical protein
MDKLLTYIIVIVVTVAIILICRAVALWYWKINRIVALLEDIESHLNHGNSDSDELSED